MVYQFSKYSALLQNFMGAGLTLRSQAIPGGINLPQIYENVMQRKGLLWLQCSCPHQNGGPGFLHGFLRSSSRIACLENVPNVSAGSTSYSQSVVVNGTREWVWTNGTALQVWVTPPPSMRNHGARIWVGAASVVELAAE